MSKLTEIVKKITQKYNIVEYEVTSDNFIFEKKSEQIKDCDTCINQNYCLEIEGVNLNCWQPIGKTEQLQEAKLIQNQLMTDNEKKLYENTELTQTELNGFLSSSGILNNSNSEEKPNKHVKTRYCCICGKQTEGGSVCSDSCFDKFIENNGLGERDLTNDITYPHEI